MSLCSRDERRQVSTTPRPVELICTVLVPTSPTGRLGWAFMASDDEDDLLTFNPFTGSAQKAPKEASPFAPCSIV
jgi:hypothetical protein